MKCIEVVAGIIRDDLGRILIARRAEGKDQSGYWEFPGGKVEACETATEALERELREELNIATGSFSYYNTGFHATDHHEITLHCFEGKLLDGKPEGSDHDKIAWVHAHELHAYEYAFADRPIVNQLIRDSILSQ
jgi:8-oxo-dGTP diphosphatase